MTTAPRPSLRERTRGRWQGILTAIGINPRYLVNKHGPCPICGGRDRFRWDNKNEDGTYFCNQCGAGAGTNMVMKVLGLPFRDAALRIEQVLGEARPEPSPRPRNEAARQAAMKALWIQGKPIRRQDPVDLWFRSRSIDINVYPAVLRCAARVRYASPTEPASYHPAMVAMVTDASDKPITLHKTYITSDGHKAAVEEPRKFCEGTIPAGSAVRLAPPHEGALGIAEGIESAFAAMQMFGVPCWAALNAGMLEKFQPPPEVKQIVICGDNDGNQRGQRASWILAARLGTGIKVDIRIPDQVDTDWNDVLMSGRAP